MKKYFKLILLLGISLIFLSGCVSELVVPENDVNSPATEGGSTDENPVEGLGTGKGTLKIYLTDAPGDYLEVNVMISKIEGHIAVEDEEGYWEKLKEWSGGLQVDLIKLEDVSILLASLELEANKYTQLRLFLMGGENDAWVVLKDLGLTEPLEIPSVYQTGIKLNRPFEIVAGSITKLTIDFDAEKSVIKTGNGKYKMKPVISMTSEINLEGNVDKGSVSGTVSYDGGDSGLLGIVGIDGASVTLSGGEYIFVYDATTSGGGSFSFDDVPIGNCVLNVYADGFNDYFESIIVEDGVDTVVNVLLSFEETGGILGKVVDSVDSVSPIIGATVSATLSGSAYIFSSSAVTDGNGEFVFEQLPVGTYDLTASATDYDNNTEYGIIVTAGGINDTVEIELMLTTVPSP